MRYKYICLAWVSIAHRVELENIVEAADELILRGNFKTKCQICRDDSIICVNAEVDPDNFRHHWVCAWCINTLHFGCFADCACAPVLISIHCVQSMTFHVNRWKSNIHTDKNILNYDGLHCGFAWILVMAKYRYPVLGIHFYLIFAYPAVQQFDTTFMHGWCLRVSTIDLLVCRYYDLVYRRFEPFIPDKMCTSVSPITHICYRISHEQILTRHVRTTKQFLEPKTKRRITIQSTNDFINNINHVNKTTKLT